MQKEGDVNGGIPKSGQRNNCVIPVDDNVHFSAQNEIQIILFLSWMFRDDGNQESNYIESFPPELYFDLLYGVHCAFSFVCLHFSLRINTVNY